MHRPGPKPKRLYLRLVRFGDDQAEDAGLRAALRTFVREFERVGRLVAHGELTDPPGDLLILRATDHSEALRLLRKDPLKSEREPTYQLLEWKVTELGSGVNIEPAPARGSGRLTRVQRVGVIVGDQTTAVTWYRDVLGLEVLQSDPETGYVELSLGPGAVALSLISPRPEWGAPYYAEALARRGTRTGIVFQTDNVAALELRLLHAGANVTHGVEPEPWGGRTMRFTDPDGNEFLAFDRGAPVPPVQTPRAARPK
ncbi:MAG TPA: VOC family protein [Thermoplasmata archaeon]|nr:VOC family protein [Thermoplasmata archaeon]